MIRTVDQEEHDGPRAEVERNTISNVQSQVALQGEFVKSSQFDVAHTDVRSWRATPLHFRVAEKTPVRYDRRQSIHMDNMTDLWLNGNAHYFLGMRARLPHLSPARRGASQNLSS